MEDPPPRHIRMDFRRFRSDIQDVIPSDVNRLSIASARKMLHQMAVTEAINGYRCNRVLNEHPPAISDSERQLPRHSRTILAQLRAGWCSFLNCYRERIVPGTLNRCPACHQSPHDTVHLFNCPARSTNLRPIDLWLRPTEERTIGHSRTVTTTTNSTDVDSSVHSNSSTITKPSCILSPISHTICEIVVDLKIFQYLIEFLL